MPNLILVRHGESTGNVLNAQLRRGADDVPAPGISDVHNAEWELTESGIHQAKESGAWIRKNIQRIAPVAFCSPYRRATQTAQLLGLDVQWMNDLLLREREVYDLDFKPSGNPDRYGELDLIMRAPLGVETYAQMAQRVEVFLSKIRSLNFKADQTVVVVTHGKLMRAFRYVLEGMNPWQFAAEYHTESSGKVSYGQILQYKSVDSLGLSYELVETQKQNE